MEDAMEDESVMDDSVWHEDAVWRTVQRPVVPRHVVVLLFAGLSALAASGSRTAADEAVGAAAGNRRPYVTGIVGSSIGGNTQRNGSIGGLAAPTLGGDAAIGVAIDRESSPLKGAVRLEFEGRTRPRGGEAGSDVAATDIGQSMAANPGDGIPSAATEWSTMANLWRDVPITEHLGGYAGGGIGAEGGRDAAGDHRSGFTWQVGGGLTYAVNDRITLDAGYRALPSMFGGPSGRGRADLPEGEMLFSVRLYEPFRGWLRH